MQSEKEWEIDNLPNRLTIFRVILIPIIVVCLFLNTIDNPVINPYHETMNWVAGWTFVLASVTDFFDGYFARKRKIVTVFGSFLDPIADKFLVVSGLILLQALGRIPVLVVIILVLREIFITALRLLATERGLTIPVGKTGKWKTAAQMVGVPFLMAYGHPWGVSFPLLGTIFIYIAAILSLFSAFEYTAGLLKKLKEKRKKNATK